LSISLWMIKHQNWKHSNIHDRNCLCGKHFLFTFYSLGPNCFEHEPVIQGWMWRSDKSHGGHTCKLVDVGSSKSVICSL
jgi:hypothetical protein